MIAEASFYMADNWDLRQRVQELMDRCAVQRYELNARSVDLIHTQNELEDLYKTHNAFQYRAQQEREELRRLRSQMTAVPS